MHYGLWRVAQVFMGVPLLNEFPLYSPFIKSIKVPPLPPRP